MKKEKKVQWRSRTTRAPSLEREIFIDNLLVRIHCIIVIIRWTGLAPWEFEFPLPGSLTSIFFTGGVVSVCTRIGTPLRNSRRAVNKIQESYYTDHRCPLVKDARFEKGAPTIAKESKTIKQRTLGSIREAADKTLLLLAHVPFEDPCEPGVPSRAP